MREYIRLHITSLIAFCFGIFLVSVLFTWLLILNASGPIKRYIKHFHLSDEDITVSAVSWLQSPEDVIHDYEEGMENLSIPREVINENNNTVLLRHPKKNDLRPQHLEWLEELHAVDKNKDYELPMSRAPQCILLGFAKCGTSALLEFLQLHPKIVSLDWEPDYFCDRMYKKYDLRWYVQKMPPSLSDQVTIEKSPCYIVEHDAHLRMKAMNDSLKLLVLVRDPVTRLLSEHAHYTSCQRYWGRKTQSFEDRFYNNKTGRFKTDMVLKVGDYTPHLQHLLKVFLREQILVVDGDKLITDPLSEISRVEAFLGLKKAITQDDIYFDEEKGFYCMRIRKTGESKCMGNSKGRKHDYVSKDFLRKLASFLKPYEEKFFKIVGQKFDWI